MKFFSDLHVPVICTYVDRSSDAIDLGVCAVLVFQIVIVTINLNNTVSGLLFLNCHVAEGFNRVYLL